MAGSGWKAWTRERLTSSQLQGYLQDQVIAQFDSNAAMDAALPAGSRAAGQATYMRDAGRFYGQYADGSRFPFGRFLGSLSAWPSSSTVGRGDYFYSIPHQCHFVAGASAVGWNQVEAPSVNGVAGRDALAAAVSAAGMYLTDGFRVFAYGLERTYMWDRAAWQLIGGKPGPERTGSGAAGAGTAQSGWTFSLGSTRHNGDGTATVYFEVARSGAALTVSGLGDVVTNTAIWQMPAYFESLGPTTLVSGWAGRAATGHLGTGSGLVYLTGVGGTGDVSTGAVISLGATYRLVYAATIPE